MDNFTYFKKEIEHIMRSSGSNIAVHKETGKPVACRGQSCSECMFNNANVSCHAKRKEWYNAEHVERPTLNIHERRLVEILAERCFIARDADGSLMVYAEKPVKSEIMSAWNNPGCFVIGAIEQTIYPGCKFDFIKWEDETPWNVVDLLELEVK